MLRSTQWPTASNGDEATGARIISAALDAPTKLIAANAGHEGAVIVQRVEAESGSTGFDVARGEMVDLIEAGVIDPVKVTRAALQNAASIAGLLLTTEVLVADKPEEDTAYAHGWRRSDGRHGWHGHDVMPDPAC